MGFSHVPVSLVVIVSNLLIVYISCDDGHDKRNLLSDPNYVQQQMTHLQGELQTLQATTQTQNGKLQTLESTVQTQTEEISSLKQQLSQANNETQNQHSEIAALKQRLSQETQNHHGEIAALNHKLAQGVGGATFVRWGRTDCPFNLTEMVYSGFAGGSWYYHSGGAADRLCLPRDPEWLHTTVVPDDYSGRLYGAEYESNNGHTLFGSHSHDEDVPCAVCRSPSYVSAVMIPARTTCYSGWTKAYGGSLAAGYYDYPAASEYVCVDEHAQPLAGGGNTNDNGAFFLGIKAFCGSLRCPPYQQDKYISCVVCMK